MRENYFLGFMAVREVDSRLQYAQNEREIRLSAVAVLMGQPWNDRSKQLTPSNDIR